MSKTRYVGQRVESLEAVERVTGRTAFGADIHLNGMLHGKVLRSPHPHAWIKHIAVDKALALEGVKAVVTSGDFPKLGGTGSPFAEYGPARLDHMRDGILAGKKVLYEGHPVAAVAATTLEAAEEALELIQVEYDLLPAIDDPLKAMEPGAPLLHEDLYTQTLGEKPQRPSNIASSMESNRGDVEAAFATSHLVMEHTCDTRTLHQGYMEPHSTTAHMGLDGRATVWTATQGSFGVQGQISALLGIAQDKLTVVPMEVGGSFGGKDGSALAVLCVMLSKRTGRPVKITMTREEVLRASGPVPGAHITIKAGATREGKLTAFHGKLVYDAGAFPGGLLLMPHRAAFGAYNVYNRKVQSCDVVTNKPRCGAYRAPGGPPVAFAIETLMDKMAEALGMDPLKFRQLNYVREGDLMTIDIPYNRVGLKDVLERAEQHPHWTSPLDGPNRGRGFAVGFWRGGTLTTSAWISIYPDGSVNLVTGQVDLTGARTSIRQIVADELQIPMERVSVRVADTSNAPFSASTSGSRTTRNLGAAAQKACQDVLGQMKQHACHQLRAGAGEIEYGDGRFWARSEPEKTVGWDQVARGSVGLGEGPVLGKGAITQMQFAPGFAAHIADVEVDPETGKVHLLRYTCVQDVGKAINPTLMESQIQGGLAQGIGWAMSEYLDYKDGKLQNRTLLDYRMPTAMDLPMLALDIVEVPAPDGPYGARGVAELPLNAPAAAIANAIYRAAGVRLTRLPMTPEEVFWAIRAKEQAKSSS